MMSDEMVLCRWRDSLTTESWRIIYEARPGFTRIKVLYDGKVQVNEVEDSIHCHARDEVHISQQLKAKRSAYVLNTSGHW